MNAGHYDVTIAGAGFAGLACARTAARSGLRTQVMERATWPGAPQRTTGILVRELAERWCPPARLCRRIEGIRLYGPDLHYMDLHSPGYYFLATDTTALINWHRRCAIEAGARVSFGEPFRHARLDAGGLEINGGDSHTRFLVGCDGARSRVARDLGLGCNRDFLIGAEAELAPLPQVDPSYLHVFLDGELAPGYIGWVVPGMGVIQAGLGCRLPRRPDLRRFLRRVARCFNVGHLQPLRFRGGLIPCGGQVQPWHGDRVLLLGDAAGTVSPVTGGGIHPAVWLGELAGAAVADHLLGNGPPPAQPVAAALPSHGAKLLLRRGMDALPVPDLLARLIFSSLPFRALAQLLFFHSRGLLSARAWRELLTLVQDH